MKGIVKKAESLLERSNHPKYKLGAVLVKSGNILSTGINRIGPKPFYVPNNLGEITIHAEVDCLHMVDRKVSNNSTLLVTGRTVAGNYMLTRPCKSCMVQIRKMGIKEIVYQTNSGDFIKERIR